jgi:hypothetical protein
MSNTTAASTSATPNSNLIYLFALGSAGLATGLQFAVPSVALYLAVIAIGGIAGMIITRAGFGKATLAFLLTSVVTAVLYYFVVAKMLADASTAMVAEAAVNESAETRALAAAGAEAGANALGALVAVWAFVQTFVPGFLGSAIGALVRPKQKQAASRASQPVMA